MWLYETFSPCIKFYYVTIQMKATEQYIVLSCDTVYYAAQGGSRGEVLPTFDSVDQILKSDHSNESYFSVVLFITLYKVVLTFESVDEILKCESYGAVPSWGRVYYAIQSRSNFLSL